MRPRLKPIAFCGDSLNELRAFPEGARQEAGFQLYRGGLRVARISEEDATNSKARWGLGSLATSGLGAEGKMSTDQVFETVWDAIEPSLAEAAHMKIRADLMIAIQQVVAAWDLTQAEAAKRLAVTQPRLNDLLRGRIGKFSLDALVGLATRAGLDLRIEIRRPAA
jgi:predicted XRE-type DNA-binding protein